MFVSNTKMGRKKVDSEREEEEDEVDEHLERFRESMVGKRIEVQCLDDATGLLEFYPCKITNLYGGDACTLEFDDDSDSEEEQVMIFPNFTLHDYDEDDEEEEFQVRRWRFARSTSAATTTSNSLYQQAQQWAIQEMEDEEASFSCLHSHNTVEHEKQAPMQQDLDLFSRGCKDVLMEYISIAPLEGFLCERCVLHNLIIPTALVVCENDYIESLVCDRLEFELNDYIHVDGGDSMPHVLHEIKSTSKPVILFTNCTRVASLDVLLLNMTKLKQQFKLVFVVQSPDFLTKLGESVCVSLDVCTFPMENSQSLFAHLLHQLVYSNRVNFTLPVFRWLVTRFDKYDFSIELFIKRIHYAILLLLPESEETELVQVIDLIKLWGRHFRILPERDSSLVTKSLLVSGFRWKEIRLRVLASGQDTIEQLKQMAATCLSAELFQAMETATTATVTTTTTTVARHKMGTKMRRIEGFKPAAQTETSKQLCHYVDSLVAKHCRGSEDDALERAFTVVSWHTTLRSPMLQRSGGDTTTPDLEHDTDMEIAYKLYTMVGAKGERDLDLYQWYQAFHAELNDDTALQRFVQTVCELKLCGVWDYQGKDKIKRLVN